MLTETAYVVDQFGYIVADAATRSGLTINYMYGHPLEIVDILSELAKTQAQETSRFPLVAFFLDFEEVKGNRPDIESVVKLNLAICSKTIPTYSATDRMTNSFKAILYPIYDALMEAILYSGYYSNVRKSIPPKHKKIDRLFWGKTGLYNNTSNMFNDYIDAIEIKDLELEVYKQHCQPTEIL